ncbi:SRPBCC domain-containing protein [Marinovum sp.]|uniref:SRPBCC family protein n=1 Tax=Marinovum sp. TaxID=2024839 RepID=UPI002B27AB46|nr:SRPBCC domain-containing protein [Marinovum sp.]
MNDLTLTVERTIAAPREALFKAWLDPDMLRRFMRPGENVTVARANADAREGGRFEIIMMAGDQALPHTGTYREISPHDRLVFTWESNHSTEADSEVTVEFTPEGAATRVKLTHVRFPSEDSRDNHKGGWTGILAALETAVA